MSFVGSQSIIIKDLSGNVAPIISGTGIAVGPAIATRFVGAFVICSSGSGGVALTSITSSMPFGITVKNVGTAVGVSGVILVGSNTSPPYASGGYPLGAGEEVKINTSQPNLIRVYGRLSGMHAGWNAVF